MRILIHQTERYHSDLSEFSGPVSGYTTGWSFIPPKTCAITNDLGLLVAQDLDPNVRLTIEVPEGSRVAKTVSGTLALFAPGNPTGLSASGVLSMARERHNGFSIAPANRDE